MWLQQAPCLTQVCVPENFHFQENLGVWGVAFLPPYRMSIISIQICRPAFLSPRGVGTPASSLARKVQVLLWRSLPGGRRLLI